MPQSIKIAPPVPRRTEQFPADPLARMEIAMDIRAAKSAGHAIFRSKPLISTCTPAPTARSASRKSRRVVSSETYCSPQLSHTSAGTNLNTNVDAPRSNVTLTRAGTVLPCLQITHFISFACGTFCPTAEHPDSKPLSPPWPCRSVIRRHDVNRSSFDESQHEATWIRHIAQIFLNHFTIFEDFARVRFTDPAFEHSPNRMNAENQPRVTHPLRLIFPSMVSPHAAATIALKPSCR